MRQSRREFMSIAAAASAALFGRALPAAAQARPRAGPVTPEMFGARGDGVADDTDAFNRLADHINAAGGGEIVLRRTTYRVGRQVQSMRRGAPMAFAPAPILELRGCSRPLRIRGNGATLRCAPGLRYGTFDPISGAETDNPMPFIGPDQLATPYFFMIKVEECTAPVTISDVELDGNIQALRLGGKYGDRGRQIPAVGLGLYNNVASETVRNVHTHHHGMDGVVVDGIDRASPVSRTLDNVRAEFNGRQGCSIIGGRGYVFTNCRFNHTGRAGVATSPGCGVDIEAEMGKLVRDLRFVECEFDDNFGCGMAADSGDSAGAVFERCRFIGATAWSAWPFKPDFRFRNCSFVGAVVRCYGDEQNPERATQFDDCIFRDDPALSPTGEVYLGNGPICDLSDAHNVRFNRCRFVLTHRGVLPWSANAIFQDCDMSQVSPQPSHPRGLFIGRNRITGNALINRLRVEGELTINGRREVSNY